MTKFTAKTESKEPDQKNTVKHHPLCKNIKLVEKHILNLKDIRAQNPGSDSKLKSFCDISITQMAEVPSFTPTTQFQQYGPK
jgi:hypothetical protein